MSRKIPFWEHAKKVLKENITIEKIKNMSWAGFLIPSVSIPILLVKETGNLFFLLGLISVIPVIFWAWYLIYNEYPEYEKPKTIKEDK
jgi:hypothetical protein